MWEAVCAGILTVNLCINPCMTMIVLAVTAAVIVHIGTITAHERHAIRKNDLSARLATSNSDVSPTQEAPREMTENPRRFVSESEKKHSGHPPQRTKESYQRLKKRLQKEMFERQHQYSSTRMSRVDADVGGE